MTYDRDHTDGKRSGIYPSDLKCPNNEMVNGDLTVSKLVAPRLFGRAHADVVRIQSFATTVEVITWSKQRPRRMTIHGGEADC